MRQVAGGKGEQLNLVLSAGGHFASLPALEWDGELKKLFCSESGAMVCEGKI